MISEVFQSFHQILLDNMVLPIAVSSLIYFSPTSILIAGLQNFVIFYVIID